METTQNEIKNQKKKWQKKWIELWDNIRGTYVFVIGEEMSDWKNTGRNNDWKFSKCDKNYELWPKQYSEEKIGRKSHRGTT